MLNFAKYAGMAALVAGLATAATKPASAWGYGYGPYAYGPYAYGVYPYGYYGYYPPFRPYYRPYFYGYRPFYGPRRFHRFRHW
jgi:hypothetical protein